LQIALHKQFCCPHRGNLPIAKLARQAANAAAVNLLATSWQRCRHNCDGGCKCAGRGTAHVLPDFSGAAAAAPADPPKRLRLAGSRTGEAVSETVKRRRFRGGVRLCALGNDVSSCCASVVSSFGPSDLSPPITGMLSCCCCCCCGCCCFWDSNACSSASCRREARLSNAR